MLRISGGSDKNENPAREDLVLSNAAALAAEADCCSEVDMLFEQSAVTCGEDLEAVALMLCDMMGEAVGRMVKVPSRINDADEAECA